jgi:hypothetical protein
MICSSVSVILPLACARAASTGRQPGGHAPAGQARDLDQALLTSFGADQFLLASATSFSLACLRRQPWISSLSCNTRCQLRFLSGARYANLEQFGSLAKRGRQGRRREEAAAGT